MERRLLWSHYSVESLGTTYAKELDQLLIVSLNSVSSYVSSNLRG
jgi:hypothetical protein